MKRKHIIAIVVLTIIALMIWQLSKNKAEINKQQNPPVRTNVKIPVKVAEAAMQSFMASLVKTGNLIPFKESRVIAPASGTVENVKINLGDHVVQGQVLASIDTRLLQLDLQKSELNVAKLKNDLKTYTELLSGKAATAEKVSEVQQNYDNAVNQSNQIRKQISNNLVKAPINGIISEKQVETGIFANAGANIATIVNLSMAKVQVKLTESEVYLVKKDQSVKITTEVYPNKVFSGKISFISPQADEAHNYLVEIQVNNSDQFVLRSGTFVYADFSKKSYDQILVIPREALTESILNASVYVVENNKVHQTPIKTGKQFGNMIEVTSGLVKGQQVVVSGQINLKEGTEVIVSN